MNTVVAIDGPAASGKSTVARRVAARLGYLYVDSGSFYRGVTWKLLRDGVDPRDREAVTAALPGIRLELFRDGAAVSFRIGGIQPVRELRTEEIDRCVSPVAATPQVRERVTADLRRAADFGDLVMEGRDIGTAVFPESPLRFYLDASIEERARRRHAEKEAGAERVEIRDVGQSLQSRDRLDSSRTSAPLRIAPGAWVIDSTAMTIDEVTERVLRHIQER